MSEDNKLQRSFFLKTVPSEYLLGILSKKKIPANVLKNKFYEAFRKEVDDPKERIKNLCD